MGYLGIPLLEKKKVWILSNGLKLKQDGLKLITKVDLDQNKWI